MKLPKTPDEQIKELKEFTILRIHKSAEKDFCSIMDYIPKARVQECINLECNKCKKDRVFPWTCKSCVLWKFKKELLSSGKEKSLH